MFSLKESSGRHEKGEYSISTKQQENNNNDNNEQHSRYSVCVSGKYNDHKKNFV